MQTLTVDLGDRSYPIHIGAGLLGQAELILPHLAQKRAVIVTNTTVAPLYLAQLTATLQARRGGGGPGGAAGWRSLQELGNAEPDF